MSIHRFVKKYSPENYQPEVYNFLADFSDKELSGLSSKASTEETIQSTANLVNSKYQFKQRAKGFSALEATTISQKRHINCYGFAIATSQILSALNINHQIAFANTHSFIIAKHNERLFIVDALLPQITGELKPNNICHRECIEKKIFSINMLNHAQEVSTVTHTNDFLRQNEWIRFSQSTKRLGSDDRQYIKPNKNPKIIARLYEPSEGVRVLYSFDNLVVSAETNRLTMGYLMTKELVNSYPELDIRNRPYAAELLIKKLGKLALNSLASNAIDNITAGLQKTNTIAPVLWRADQYSQISKLTSKKIYLNESVIILDSLLENPKLSQNQINLIAGKLNKYKRLFEN
jgi:hypothetical protein